MSEGLCVSSLGAARVPEGVGWQSAQSPAQWFPRSLTSAERATHEYLWVMGLKEEVPGGPARARLAVFPGLF